MDDQRRSRPRKRTLLQRRIVFNARFSLIECVVRDLSATGARIAFPHPIDIPLEFELEIPSKTLSLRSRVNARGTRVRGILDEARHRIAQELGIHVDAISLRMEVGPRDRPNKS
jgi:hypothetical protein